MKSDKAGSNESFIYGKLTKNDTEDWYILFRCQGCNAAVHEHTIDYNSFDWNKYKAGLDQKKRILHRCNKDYWHYSTVIIKGKRYRKCI
jgi:hypothetical protein